MAHFAKIDDNNIVIDVIVADQDYIDTRHDYEKYVQTSYNTKGGVHYDSDHEPDGGTALRKNFAGIGYTYDWDRDAFIPPKPYPSWTLNEGTCLWEPPVAEPDDGGIINEWNERTRAWVRIV